MLRLPVLRPENASLASFVAFWDAAYSGYDEEFYQCNVGQPLTEERIAQWFEWKNGTPLSPRKAESIRRYLSPREMISAEADEAALEMFLNRPGGAIWRIFWLHLQHPTRFPIYDQHVHRAMVFIREGKTLEIPAYNPQKVQCYLQRYIPFFRQFAALPARRVDRALWAFGKFVGSECGLTALGAWP